VPTQKVPESGVLRACLDLLAAEKIWHMRMNTGAMSGSHKGKRWFVRYAKPGTADILAAHTGLHHCLDHGLERTAAFLWIECKGSHGRQTPEQELFEREVSEQGHHYLLVRDVETLRNWLKEKQAR
jgi:hypothetical protein